MQFNLIIEIINTVCHMLHFFPELAFISRRKEAAVKMKAYDVVWCWQENSLCETSISDGVIINCYTLLLFHFVQMNSTFVDNDTLSSLLHLYRQCKERGETVSLSLDTRWMVVLKFASYILTLSLSWIFFLPSGMEITLLHFLSNPLWIQMSEMSFQKTEIQ